MEGKNFKKKYQNLLSFVTFKELYKSVFLKDAAQTFEVGDFLKIFLRFLLFEAHFLVKSFLIKKACTPS